MLLRKLAVNFVQHGSMVTTEKKGKALSSYVATLVEKAKKKSEANKNFLLQEISSSKTIADLFNRVGPTFKDVSGGYITLQRLQQRLSDGAMMVKVSWVKPLIEAEPVVKETRVKTVEAEAKVKTEAAPKKRTKTVKKTK
jgi:large subunit ribosomal protein L17